MTILHRSVSRLALPSRPVSAEPCPPPAAPAASSCCRRRCPRSREIAGDARCEWPCLAAMGLPTERKSVLLPASGRLGRSSVSASTALLCVHICRLAHADREPLHAAPPYGRLVPESAGRASASTRLPHRRSWVSGVHDRRPASEGQRAAVEEDCSSAPPLPYAEPHHHARARSAATFPRPASTSAGRWDTDATWAATRRGPQLAGTVP